MPQGPCTDTAATSPAVPTRARADHRYELPVAPADRETVAARLWAAGAAGIWERVDRLVAWFPDRDADVPPGGTWSREPDRDWQAAWKATITPVRAGRFVVVPSWLAATHHGRDDDEVLVIDPGRAFGTGHHATTTLCLEALDRLDLVGRRVVDIGCGTGVLGIAAARRGATVEAVDVDPDAVTIARANAASNGVDVTVSVGSVEAVGPPADVVVANLVTDVLLGLVGALAAATHGTLVVSGVSQGRRAEVAAALEASGLDVTDVRARAGWVALVAVRPRGWTP